MNIASHRIGIDTGITITGFVVNDPATPPRPAKKPARSGREEIPLPGKEIVDLRPCAVLSIRTPGDGYGVKSS